MSYVTVTAGSEQDLDAQFRAFVLGDQPPEGTAVASTGPAAPPVDDQAAVRLPTDQVARQASVDITTGEPASSSVCATASDASVLHFTVQCFLDHVLIFITEDETCAPGVMVRYDPFHNGSSQVLYDEEVPSVECTVLFGLRDHPLTNLIASTVAHAIRQYGETRPLLMGISVAQMAKRLAQTTPQARKDFLTLVKNQVMRLAVAPS